MTAGTVFVSFDGGGYSLAFRSAATMVLWWMVVVGVLSGVMPRSRTPRAAIVAGVLLGLFALLTALSLSWASDDERAFSEVVRVVGYTGLFVLVVIASRRGGGQAWLAGLAIGLFAVAALAVASRLAPGSFPDDQLATFLPSARTRLSYPIGYWNGLGALMALAIVLLAGLGAGARSRAGRALAVAAIPVPALALFLTSSRGGVAAGAAGLVVLLLAGPSRARLLAGAALGGAGAAIVIVGINDREQLVDATGSKGAAEMFVALVVVVLLIGAVRYLVDGVLVRLRVPRAVAIAAALAAAAAVVVGLVALDPIERLDDFKQPPADAQSYGGGFVARHLASTEGNGRYQFWKAGWDAFERHPVAGLGAGEYESWWAREGSLGQYVRDAHSLYAETLAELGILGVMLLGGFIVTVLLTGVGRARAPADATGAIALGVFGCGVVSAGIDWTWEISAVFAPVVIAAALLVGSATNTAAPAPRANPVPGSGYGWRVVTLLAAWAALIVGAMAFAGDLKLEESRAAAERGDFVVAADAARDASAVAPWAAGPRLQLALVEELRGDLDAALEASADALEHAPENWRIWLVQARLLTKADDVEAAERAVEESRRLNPRSPLFESLR